MKKIILTAMISAGVFGSDVACEFHIKKTHGLFDTIRYALDLKDISYAKKASLKFKMSLYKSIEHCGKENEFIETYVEAMKKLSDGGMFNGK